MAAPDPPPYAGMMPPVLTLNRGGRSDFVLVCDHASNRIPAAYADLGLSAIERLDHIAWDPGALAVSLGLMDRLDAPLVHATVSRLVVDCNRGIASPDLMPVISERTRIAGNEALTAEARRVRIERFHAPFHAAIEKLLDARLAERRPTILVAVHSFTPVFMDVARPWPIGLVHGVDPGFTAALRAALAADDPALPIGWNQPYAALKGVTYTLEHHGDGRALPSSMLEIRNDGILEPAGVAQWVGRLARALEAARHEVAAAS